jgi:hypothetical protein
MAIQRAKLCTCKLIEIARFVCVDLMRVIIISSGPQTISITIKEIFRFSYVVVLERSVDQTDDHSIVLHSYRHHGLETIKR